jgi:hypothetical protein
MEFHLRSLLEICLLLSLRVGTHKILPPNLQTQTKHLLRRKNVKEATLTMKMTLKMLQIVKMMLKVMFNQKEVKLKKLIQKKLQRKEEKLVIKSWQKLLLKDKLTLCLRELKSIILASIIKNLYGIKTQLYKIMLNKTTLLNSS